MDILTSPFFFWLFGTIFVFCILVLFQLLLFRINGLHVRKTILWRIFKSGGNITAYYHSLILLKSHRLSYEKYKLRLYVCAKNRTDVNKIAAALIALERNGKCPTIKEARKLVREKDNNSREK